MVGLSTGKKFCTVTSEELNQIPVPANTNTWQPIQHGWLYKEVVKSCMQRGYAISMSDLRVTTCGNEFFGIIRLRQTVDPGNKWDLSLGIRNTNNKRASAGLFLGTNVYVCDNLQFSAEHTFLRKHHAGSYDAIRDGLCNLTRHLDSYRQNQKQYIHDLQNWMLTPELRNHLIIRSLQSGALLSGQVLKVVNEYMTPSEGNPEAVGNSAWNLLNAVTWVQKDGYEKNPETQAQRSIQLQKVFYPV